MQKTAFYGKTWYHYVTAIMFSAFAGISGSIGLLFCAEILQRPDGKSATAGGFIMLSMAALMSLVALLGWFNVYARCQPLLRIGNDGLQVVIIGVSSRNCPPLVPYWLWIIWLILSRRAFRKRVGWIPWTTFRKVEAVGLPMMQALVIDAIVAYPVTHRGTVTLEYDNVIMFLDSDLRDPLPDIAEVIMAFYHDSTARKSLPGLLEGQNPAETKATFGSRGRNLLGLSSSIGTRR